MTDGTIILTVSGGLFTIGLLCLVLHRSAVRILIGVELMLNASILNFVHFAVVHGDTSGGVFAIAVMAGAAAETAVALALVLALFAQHRRSDLTLSDELAG